MILILCLAVRRKRKTDNAVTTELQVWRIQ